MPASDSGSNKNRLKGAAASKLDKRRQIKDKTTNFLIASGGVFVLVAISAIFLYLFWVSWPLFKTSGADQQTTYASAPTTSSTALVQVDEYNETGMRILPNNQTVEFFTIATGETVSTVPLKIPDGAQIVRIKRGTIIQGHVGIGLSDGSLLVIKPEIKAQGLGDEREVTVSVKYPFGEAPMAVGNTALTTFDILEDDGSLLVFAHVNNQLILTTYSSETSGSMALEWSDDDSTSDYSPVQTKQIAATPSPIQALEIGQGARRLYAITEGGYVEVMENGPNQVTPVERVKATSDGARISATNMLQGDISLILGDTKGNVSQWFMVPSEGADRENNFTFTKIRSFKLADNPITVIEPELRRKGILAGDTKGNVAYFYTTSERHLETINASEEPITALNMSSHGDGLLVSNTSGSSFWNIDAYHPEVSMSSIWGQVWYESYPEPNFVWQSSSGNIDFEPKLSLVPLTFGTLKAAFWAMILSAPLAIAGAMYTAIFMSPALRTKVKPALELMEALPTVILGFLAGLWLAPLVSEYLPAIFSLIVVVPVVVLLVGFLWMQMPLERRNSIPDGIAPAVLILPVIIGSVIAFMVSETLEQAVFADYSGSLVNFLKAQGIDYQNQNALIVGLMMGFAVIPTIFSIAEDALFAVPRHLTNGSLALGATPWQTMVRVVLPTASPGIFSALMIGFGRAVGETMIVLMATGNTPIMDLSLFNGMRTLSANVAVEMGEAERNSTHFRVLFLSALVLFVLTFLLNTLAEVVRNRLRKKYGSL